MEVGPYDPALPITAWHDEIAQAIETHQVLIVAGETGSGKTTQLPKICLELGRRSIGHTQPRRIAARTVAERVAYELGTEVGDLVGYQVRFTRQASRATRLKVMTDGVLLAEISRDRDLRRYDTIILDEAHERSLNIDFLLGYLRQLMERRRDLKIIITSATIDTELFSAHFAERRRRRCADHRGLRPDLSGRGALSPAAGRRRGRPGRRHRGRRRRAERPGPGRHPGLSVRRAGDPRCRRGAPRPPAAGDRDPAPVRPAVRRGAAAGLRAPPRPADRAGHQRRGDLAHRARHPVRGGPRHGPGLPLLGPDQGAAAADRADLPGLGGPAGGTLRAGGAGGVHPPLQRGGPARPARSSPNRRSCAPTWPR